MTNTADTPEMLTELRAIRALLERQLVLSMCLTSQSAAAAPGKAA